MAISALAKSIRLWRLRRKLWDAALDEEFFRVTGQQRLDEAERIRTEVLPLIEEQIRAVEGQEVVA